MKHRRLFKWIVFLTLASLFVLLRSKCASAASEVPITTPIPIEIPELPDPTPIPSEYFSVGSVQRYYQEGLRSYDQQHCTLYYKPYTMNRAGASSSYTFQEVSLTGATRTSQYPIWQPSGDEALNGADFRQLTLIKYKNQYTFTSYTNTRTTSFKTGSFCFVIDDYPFYDNIDRNCIINYYFDGANCGFHIVNPPQIFTDLGFDDSVFDSFEVSISVLSYVSGGDGAYEYQYQQPTLTVPWTEFKAGVSFPCSLSFLDDSELLNNNLISITFDPHFSDNIVLSTLKSYYNENQTPLADRLYGVYGMYGNGLNICRSVVSTEEKHRMNWFEKLIFPDADWVAQYTSDFVTRLNQNATCAWAFQLRGVLYNLLTGSFRDFIINVPTLRIMDHVFFDGYQFNFTQLANSSGVSSLFTHARTIISILLTAFFLNSVVTAVFGFFNLKLYNGVFGEDAGE